MFMPKISVVVPVYNAARYLRQCVESILAQTLDNIELILVDDGSTDASGKICDEYARKDERVSVGHQDNGGEMAARAAGVRSSHGNWLCFVDADDTIKKDALETMAGYITDDVALVALESEKDEVLSAPQFAQRAFSFKGFEVWGKLYRRSLFDEYTLSVPPYFKVGEDFLTVLRLIKNIKSGGVILSSYKKYEYNAHSESSVQKSHRSSYEYECRLMAEVENIVNSYSEPLRNDKGLQHSYLSWRLSYLGGMIGLRYPVDYSAQWVRNIKEDSGDFSLTRKQRMTLKAIDRPLYRLYFVAEKKTKLFCRKILVFFHLR